MGRISRRRAVLVLLAVLATALVVIRIGVGDGDGGCSMAALFPTLIVIALLNSVLIYGLWVRRRPGKKPTRAQRVSIEFRREIERFLSAGGRGERRRPDPTTIGRPAPPPPPTAAARPLTPPHDLITRIAENLEILGGYREDLSALLRLYKIAADDSLSLDERKKTEAEIQRFAKVIALPFLLEDSVSVQDETRQLLSDLRRSLDAEEGSIPAREEWTPVNLNDQIEQVIRSLPEERARAAYFERHLGDMPLVLSRPNSLFEAFYYVLDCILDTAGPGKAIHIRTATRGDDVWVGVSIGPSERGAARLAEDRRLGVARDLWKDLGGEQTVGNGEVTILLPMHGPASVFSDRPSRTADEKTS
jgi:hypothetical protein